MSNGIIVMVNDGDIIRGFDPSHSFVHFELCDQNSSFLAFLEHFIPDMRRVLPATLSKGRVPPRTHLQLNVKLPCEHLGVQLVAGYLKIYNHNFFRVCF